MASPRVHRVRIDGFRGLSAPIDLDFTTPRGDATHDVIVLAGPNGSGKTAILEAILLALKQEDKIVRGRSGEHGWRVAVPRQGAIRVDVSFDGGPVQTLDPALAEALPGGLEVEYFSSWRAPELRGAVRPLVGAGGRPPDTESNRLWRLKQRINDQRARRGYSADAASSSGLAERWLEKINQAWRHLRDDGTRLDAQIVDPDAEDLMADLFVVLGDRRICGVDQLSSGEIELLVLAGAVVLNELEDGLVLIDEPELHLHAEWQAAILPALRSLAPKAQFVVATHSDVIWDRASGAARFSLLDHRLGRAAE